MFATSHGHTITMSKDIARAFTGVTKGYRVQLHVMPAWTFNVEADSMDEAIRLAHALAVKENAIGRNASNAATAQRLA